MLGSGTGSEGGSGRVEMVITGKVLKWLSVEGWGKQPCYKEKHGRRYCPLRKEVILEI